MALIWHSYDFFFPIMNFILFCMSFTWDLDD